MTTSSVCRRAIGVAILVALASGCSRSAQTYVERGDVAIARGDVAAAILEYRNAVEKDPRSAAARQKLAQAHVRQGNGAAALAEYVRAADLLPDDVGAQLEAGKFLGLARRFEDAKARADKALAIDPKNVGALVLRANALAGLTDLEGALAQIQEAVNLDPRSSIQANMGAIQAAQGNLPEAEASFRKAVATDPTSVSAQVALGQFLWTSSKPADAEAAFRAAVNLAPANELANRWMATFYVGSGRAPEAEAYLKKVAEVSKSPASWHALADYYVSMHRPAEGIAVLEKLSADPGLWGPAQAKIAEIQFAQGRKDEAFRTVTGVITRHPSMAQARVVRGQFLVADGRLDEALADGQEAVKLDPQSPAAHSLMGAVHEAKGDMDAAAASFGEVLRLNPRAASVQVRLAMIEMQRNGLPAATQLAEQAAAAEPANLGAQLVLARALIGRGDVARAAVVTERLVRQSPEVGAVQNQVGMLALARGDTVAARAAFERAVAQNDTLVEPLVALVRLDIQERRPDQARARVESRLKRTPNNSLLLWLAGRTWAATGDLSKAEAFLRRAIDVDASNFEAYAELARVYMAQQKMDAAVVEFDKLAAKQPSAVGPPTLAALIVQAQGKEAEARGRFERVVDLDSRAAVACNNLAWIYASRGERLDRALQLAQAAKAQLPDHPEVNDTLAFVYLKKQLPALAIPPLKLALDKDPYNAAFHYRLGVAYAQTGNKQEARQSLEHALKLKADFDGASDARKVLQTLE